MRLNIRSIWIEESDLVLEVCAEILLGYQLRLAQGTKKDVTHRASRHPDSGQFPFYGFCYPFVRTYAKPLAVCQKGNWKWHLCFHEGHT